MENSDKTHKISCDFGEESNGFSVSARSRGCHKSDETKRKLRRSRTRTGGARRRFRWDGSGLATPLVQWKLDGATATAGGRIRPVRGGVVVAVSARKLAAGMWHLAFDRLQFGLQSPLSPISKSAMEGGARWDHACPNALRPSEVCQFHCNGRLPKRKQVATISVASALQVELVRARNHVKELESERLLIKKKLKQFLRVLSEEKASWMRRENHKMLLKIDDLKGELKRERKKYQKMDFVNSELLSDLTDAKLLAKQFKQEYEKEKNARELLEDICHDLGKDIEDHKGKIRAMKIECANIQEEVDIERKMMQIAEVWREERVQMKLIDEKLILEEKYCQMNNLIADLESLLRSNSTTPDLIKTSEAEGISLAIDSFSIHDIKELYSTPPIVNDIHTIIENLQDNGTMETGRDEWLSHFSRTHSSKFHNFSPEANEFTKKLVYKYSDRSFDHDRSSRNDSFRETVTCVNDKRSNYTLGEGACSVDEITGCSYISSATIGNDQNQESLNSKTKKISMEKLKNNGPSLRKLWRSTPSAADVLRTISVDENGRLSNGSNSSNVALSPEKMLEEVINHNEPVGHWCLPGQRNPHIARAMRGCIEWPRGIQRYGLKAKLLETSLESQKKQLYNILKQRIK